MTISLPELPQLGIAGLLYIMATLSFLICWAASNRAASIIVNNTTSAFWKFIAAFSGTALVLTFFLATIFLIIGNGGRCLPT